MQLKFDGEARTHMRLDRLITLYLASPLIRKANTRSEIRIPILMYHSISNDPEDGIHPYYTINTTPKIFAEQIKFLYENDYSVVTLDEAVRLIESFRSHPISQPPYYPIKCVVLTFDDGYKDFYTDAFPILKQYSFSATVFLPTNFIDNKRKFCLKGKEHLSWDEIRELKNEGFTFGSHTVTHSQLEFLKIDEIQYEVKQSKDVIEDKIGESVESFSYPFAFPEDRKFKEYLRDTLEKCGYKNGVSTRIGTVNREEDRFFLKRIPVNSFDDIPFLEAKLKRGYDWLQGPQCYFKRMRRIIY
jgi:peptidoglycan/xylan/chitin deacetylase (PgdA/CDA1 family)